MFLPPPIDQRALVAKLKDHFPSHTSGADTLIADLVHGYSVWWTLMEHFPERPIVTTCDIWVVRQTHASDRAQFFHDCLQYLGRIPQPTEVWDGTMTESRSVLETDRTLRECFDHVPAPWEPLQRAAEAYKTGEVIWLN